MSVWRGRSELFLGSDWPTWVTCLCLNQSQWFQELGPFLGSDWPTWVTCLCLNQSQWSQEILGTYQAWVRCSAPGLVMVLPALDLQK
jgi:hypothetical protein